MKKVLLTDDNEDTIELVKLVLANSGYEMITAGDGATAVDICLNEQPDLVLMDLNMPGMGGLNAVRMLRDRGFQQPIVVLTASESADDREAAKNAGCNDYVLKTLDMSGLERVIDSYLREAGGV